MIHVSHIDDKNHARRNMQVMNTSNVLCYNRYFQVAKTYQLTPKTYLERRYFTFTHLRLADDKSMQCLK